MSADFHRFFWFLWRYLSKACWSTSEHETWSTHMTLSLYTPRCVANPYQIAAALLWTYHALLESTCPDIDCHWCFRLGPRFKSSLHWYHLPGSTYHQCHRLSYPRLKVRRGDFPHFLVSIVSWFDCGDGGYLIVHTPSLSLTERFPKQEIVLVLFLN
jgi:hypothetical protein